MFRNVASVSRRVVIAPMKVQRRFAGGYFNKNIRVEENAGLREISYKTWEFDLGSISRLLGYMIIPGALFYTLVIEENQLKNAHIGKTVEYGIVPPSKGSAEH